MVVSTMTMALFFCFDSIISTTNALRPKTLHFDSSSVREERRSPVAWSDARARCVVIARATGEERDGEGETSDGGAIRARRGNRAPRRR